jgi:copper chaperone NosL
VGLGVLALAYEFGCARLLRRDCPACTTTRANARAAAAVTSIMAMVFAFGCARVPQAISYGNDACEFCSMTISDDRYGAAIVTVKGRTHKFDSIECMLQSMMEGEKLAGTEVDQWYATSYPNRGALVPAPSATFLVSEGLPSPMGAGLTAFADRVDAERMQQQKGGEVLDWSGVGNLIRTGSRS